MKDSYSRLPYKIFRPTELSNLTALVSFLSSQPAISAQAPGQASKDEASGAIEKKHLWESSTPVFH